MITSFLVATLVSRGRCFACRVGSRSSRLDPRKDLGYSLLLRKGRVL